MNTQYDVRLCVDITATMVVDAAVGGNLLGSDAMSAVDLVMPVYELFHAFVMLVGMGA